MANTVAALYIDPRGPYPRMDAGEVNGVTFPNQPRAIDCWDAGRDARLYAGPHPVVAHPPCGPWGRLRHLYKGSEHDCAPRAVEQVRAYGGVLEHPAESRLWPSKNYLGPRVYESTLTRTEALPLPGAAPDCDGGYTIEVNQCEWGHVARKRTWLYIVGVPKNEAARILTPPFPGREPTHWISGGRGRKGKKAKTTPVPAGIKVASACQRRRTPPLFAEALIALARAVRLAR